MVKFSESELDEVFSALADGTRRRLVRELAHGPRAVSDLWQSGEISLPGLTKHIKVLEQAGLIQTRKSGRVRTCELKAERLKHIEEWCAFYASFWESNLESLDQFLIRKMQSTEDQT